MIKENEVQFNDEIKEFIDSKVIEAKNDNGVLTITLPKTEKEMKSLKKVEVK